MRVAVIPTGTLRVSLFFPGQNPLNQEMKPLIEPQSSMAGDLSGHYYDMKELLNAPGLKSWLDHLYRH